MASNVQSIIACLGDPVAGNPTQFLMQRAAAALSLDWMFVTAEVSEPKLVEAFRGIRALQFSGVAFMPPHRTIGCSLVDSMTEAAHRSGHVRVARRDGELWLGDDTLGAGVVELLKSSGGFRHTGESATPSDSVILVSGKPWLSHLIRLASPPPWYRLLREVVAQTPSESPPAFPLTPLHEDTAGDDRSDCASIPSLSIEAVKKLDEPIAAIIVDGMAPCIAPRHLSKLQWSSEPVIIFVEPNPEWDVAISAAKIPNVKLMRSLDLSAAKAVANFLFWTGQEIDLTFIREALDEYCQW